MMKNEIRVYLMAIPQYSVVFYPTQLFMASAIA